MTITVFLEFCLQIFFYIKQDLFPIFIVRIIYLTINYDSHTIA